MLLYWLSGERIMYKGKNVLLVDDEESILKAIKRALRHEVYDVITANCPDDALKILEKGDIDVVLSDLKMPRMSGLSFLKKVKAMYPDIVRVILTGHAELKIAISAINEGEIFRFLTKPWEDDMLKLTIREAIAQRVRLLEKADEEGKDEERRKHYDKLEDICPGITKIKRDSDGSIIIGDN